MAVWFLLLTFLSDDVVHALGRFTINEQRGKLSEGWGETLKLWDQEGEHS